MQINNLEVEATIEAQVKADVETAVNTYFRSLRPFIDGLDVPSLRNDLITDLTVSEVVQDVLGANGASAEGVGFGVTAGSIIPSYRLSQGETGKNGGITYV